MKNRSAFWDNYKGLLILLVVFSQFLYSYAMNLGDSFANEAFKFIYIFGIPAFVFCAGYMSKSDNSKALGSLLRLLIYYLIFNTLMMVFENFYLNSDVQILTPYLPFWFIIALIVWRIMARHIGEVKGIVIFTLLVSLLSGFWDMPDMFAVRRILVYMFFFMAGYKINAEKIASLIESKSANKYIVGVIACIVGIAVAVYMIYNTELAVSMVNMKQYDEFSDFVYRVAIFAVATLVITAMLCLLPNKKIPLLTQIGKNSFLIFVVHRFIAVIYYEEFFEHEFYSRAFVIYAFIAAVATCIIFGSEKLNVVIDGAIRKAVDMLMVNSDNCNCARTVILTGLVLVLCLSPLHMAIDNYKEKQKEDIQSDEGYLTAEQESDINDAIKISYVGDILLMKDMIESAYDEDSDAYNFDHMFEYTEEYLSDADYAFGVFEGTLAGEKKGYTDSNYKDGMPLYFNYPDEFAKAVKDAGIDMVTLATNHILDKGLKGTLRTLDVLDEVGLEHTGAYRKQEEKDSLQIIEVEGVKIAVLSYLNDIKKYDIEEITEEMGYLTSVTPWTDNKYYDKLYAEIKEDFRQAKKSDADLIVVMSHMGKEASHETDAFQEKWNKIYAELGADVILGDHAQAVQPIEYMENGTLVVNCPGNYLSSYIREDGDASAIVEFYIDRDSKKVIASSIVPLYAQEIEKGKFRAVPINSIVSKNVLYRSMHNDDLIRMEEVLEIVTENMIGEMVSINDVRERYYFIGNEYLREKRSILKSSHDYSDKKIYKLINEAQEVAFIGDSITRGSKDNEWYKALMEDFPEKDVVSISKGFYTSKLIVENFSDEILNSASDLYIIAIGANDVRYRDPEICSMTPEEYVETLGKITSLIEKSNSDAEIVVFPPWRTCENDAKSKLNHKDKLAMIDEFAEHEKVWAEENGYTFINPNPWLEAFLFDNVWWLHTLDGRHATVPTGVEMYSKAVLESSE